MNSDVIEISGNGFRYPAVVGRGLIAKAAEMARNVTDRDRCTIIADQNSARLFGNQVSENFRSKKFSSKLITIQAGEKSKSLTQVEKICDEMIKAGLDRSSFVVGLGGGVVGDISGFVAAIFQRGIPHIQIPTTLLAMVDSSIGGKTGANLKGGKNLVGAFYHPALIICDVDALETLPPQELRQGYAEIIKHAIIRDAEMFYDLSSSRAPIHRSGDALVELIRRNIGIKARIVSVDDRETSGERSLLNFGHTVGHGIERATDSKIPHGDCVSIGMVAACAISMKRAALLAEQLNDVVALLKKFSLPTQLPTEVNREKIIGAIAHDKKFVAGKIRFVVTPKIGEAYVSSDVTMDDIREAIDDL
ncbi:MAG TPA: 3-dehydroquinate synthase [Chthoniobacterales bacterium]|nr:3-dehydroquinate synthase [Chthoniobacterales bacterium]